MMTTALCVIPAKAGTHIRSFSESCGKVAAIDAYSAFMGPGFRRDDDLEGAARA
ncbi:hypothetical protein [Rhizorhabdus argentea]|uniref:hypothetical protein n=1 Tax=Rhizorhabdus argentea TaxID=1387174 RepID=UPI0030EE5758